MTYLALIGDLCDSRHLNNRKAVQQQLQTLLLELNDQYASSLLSPFTLTLGDEFQAVLGSTRDLWPMLAVIQASLQPVRVRFGLGVGAIDTDINPDSALGMDGPAFHRARDAVNALKEEGGYFRVAGIPRPELSNHGLALLSGLQDKWHDTRFAVFAHYLKQTPVDTVAEALGISKVAVYKNINDGMLPSLRGLVQAVAVEMDVAMESES